MTPESLEKAVSNARQVLSGKQIPASVYEFIAKDGARRFGEVSSSPLTHEGRIIGIASVARDITERRRIEMERDESERRYRALYNEFQGLLNGIPDIISLYSKELKILWANQAAFSAFGKNNTGMAGKYCYQLHHGRSEPCESCPVQKSFCSGKMAIGEITSDDGQIWELRAIPIPDEEGGIREVIEIGRNITESKQSEEYLRQSEETLRGIFKAAPISLAIMQNRIFQNVNKAVFELYGFLESDIIGQTSRIFYETEEEYERVGRQLYTDLEQKGLAEIQTKHLCKDGSLRDVIIRAAPLLSEGQSSRVATVAVQDITELKEAEEKLIASRRYLENIIDFLPDATFVIDREGEVIAWNRAIEEMTGVKSKDMLGKGNYEYSIPFYNEKRPILVDLVLKRDAEIECKYNRLDINGDVLFAENYMSVLSKYLSAAATVLRDSEGRVIGAIESIRNITDRKLTEEELVWKTTFLEAQVEANIDGILVVDEKGQIILVNQRLLDTWKVPQHIREDKDDASLLRYVTSITKSPEKFFSKVSYLYNHPNERSWDEIEFKNGMVLDRYSSPVSGKDGKYYGRIWTFRDITERKQAEEALKESQRRLSDIIEFLPDATLVIDREGKVITWNRAIEDMTGIKAGDMSGEGELRVRPAILRGEKANTDRPSPQCGSGTRKTIHGHKADGG